jgi:hypothetical protein
MAAAAAYAERLSDFVRATATAAVPATATIATQAYQGTLATELQNVSMTASFECHC